MTHAATVVRAAVDTGRPPTLLRLVNLTAVILPLCGFIATVVLLWRWGIDRTQLAIFATMYLLTGFGITVGFHRLFTHRAFEAARPLQMALAVLGSMAVEGPLLRWVAHHRVHHQRSDTDQDVHSPHVHDSRGGVGGTLAGLWHAHVGWLFEPDAPGLARYVGDLRKDRLLGRVSRLFPLWVALGLLVPALLGGLLTWSWVGALLGFLWGGLSRVFLVHHVTWSINSVCHLWGSRPFESHDESRNNVVFGVLAMGEGWHNNHHAFPTSARHGLAWWQPDVSYGIIRGLEWVGLASKVKVPDGRAMIARPKSLCRQR
jgi:stearoyl-CoA desaturase (delta-9 desaturase)